MFCNVLNISSIESICNLIFESLTKYYITYKMKKSNIFVGLALTLFISQSMMAQYNPLGMENSFMQMDRQRGFILASSAALGSFLVSQFLLDDPQLTFYQAHCGYYWGYEGSGNGMPGGEEGESMVETNTYDNAGKLYQVTMQNFGVEREFAPWFSMRLEFNVQEMMGEDYFNAGAGIKTYYKWTFLRKKKIHPFIEYGAGIFCAIDKFPEDGSIATFNLNYALGAEYVLPNNDKIMLDFNFKHHSNNNLGDSNPGFDGNGFSLTYSWAWKEKVHR